MDVVHLENPQVFKMETQFYDQYYVNIKFEVINVKNDVITLTENKSLEDT